MLAPDTKVCRDFSKEKHEQKKYYDRGTKELSLLKPGMPVRLFDIESRKWSRIGKILEQVAPRSYTVKCNNGGVYRRNRGHLRVEKTSSTDGSGLIDKETALVSPNIKQKRERRAPARLIAQM